jgi:hypothetical protein
MGWGENAFLWETGRVQKMKLVHAYLDAKRIECKDDCGW